MKHRYRISRECKEWAIGKEWTFARFTRRRWEQFADYGKTRLPSPVKEALAVIDQVTARDAEILRGLVAADAKEQAAAEAEKRSPVCIAERFQPFANILWDKALAWTHRYLDAGSPELNGLMDSIEGGAYLFYLLLKPNHPDIDEDTAFQVYSCLRMNSLAIKEDENGKPILDKDGKTIPDGDGRKTIGEILDICSGRSPEPEKNEPSPAP